MPPPEGKSGPTQPYSGIMAGEHPKQEHVIERAVILSEGPELELIDWLFVCKREGPRADTRSPYEKLNISRPG